MKCREVYQSDYRVATQNPMTTNGLPTRQMDGCHHHCWKRVDAGGLGLEEASTQHSECELIANDNTHLLLAAGSHMKVVS